MSSKRKQEQQLEALMKKKRAIIEEISQLQNTEMADGIEENNSEVSDTEQTEQMSDGPSEDDSSEERK